MIFACKKGSFMALQTFLGNLRISPWLMLALLLLAGCQPTVYLMPTPVAIQGGRIDPFVHNPNLERSNRIRIFYATNRQPAEGEAGYGNVPDERLHLGEAELKIGDRQTLWEQLYAASTRKKRDRRWPLRLVDVRESAAYPADLPPETLSPALRRFFRQLNAAAGGREWAVRQGPLSQAAAGGDLLCGSGCRFPRLSPRPGQVSGDWL